MSLDFHQVLMVSTILFAVIDVIGSIPAILAIRTRVGTIHPEKATGVSLLIMVVFLFIGQNILDFLGVDVELNRGLAGSLEEKRPPARSHEQVADELGLSVLLVKSQTHQMRIKRPLLSVRVCNHALSQVVL